MTLTSSLPASPGFGAGLFSRSLRSAFVSPVQRSSVFSSNLAVSRSFGRSGSRSAAPSPLVGPSSSGPPHLGRLRSTSSSRFGGDGRFRGGEGSAPSSEPRGFR